IGMGAAVADDERIAVGRRLCDALRADRAGGGANVLDHDRLMQQLADALGLDAHAHVEPAAGRKRNDERDRPRRPFLRTGRAGGEDVCERGNDGPSHGVLLPPPVAVSIAGARALGPSSTWDHLPRPRWEIAMTISPPLAGE